MENWEKNMTEEPKFYEKFIQRKTSDNEKNTSSLEKKSKKEKSAKRNSAAFSNASKSEKSVKSGNFHSSTEKHTTEKRTTPKIINKYSLENILFSTEIISKESKEILENFDQIVQSVRPMNSKQIQQLPDNIKNLSHQLTDQRSERRLGYLNDNIQLSSYVRYYTWWNLVRLTRLFSNLPREAFPQDNQICLDLGTGPLTVITALWLACPFLRNLKLTWYCLDVSSNSMIFGEDIYYSIAAKTPQVEAWKIIRVKGAFGTQIKQKSDFITCANMLNEVNQASQMPPEFQAKKIYQQLCAYASENARFLLIEPGVPKSSRLLSLLRTRFLDDGKRLISPCPHCSDCPMNGFKAYTGSSHKWCNFAFSTEDAPLKLQKLSEKAKLPKERATLSFISVAENQQDKSQISGQPSNPKCKELYCTVVSDCFNVGGKQAFYACSELGLTLLKMNDKLAEKKVTGQFEKQNKTEQKGLSNQKELEKSKEQESQLKSGDLLKIKITAPELLQKDEKSGAVIIDL